MKLTDASIEMYDSCGNRLLVVHLLHPFSYTDAELREKLRNIGLAHNVDSVLVVTGNPSNALAQGYHLTMDVVEPHGHDPASKGLAGSWSTMCGNGIRALGLYLLNRLGESNSPFVISTRSGLIEVEALPNNLFRVCMGRFTQRMSDLSRYVSNFNFSSISPRSSLIKEVALGLNGHQSLYGEIDGEPHLIILVEGIENINNLVSSANEIAPPLARNRIFFPQQINVSLVSVVQISCNIAYVIACTFERGVERVTQACGTAATAIGSYLLSKNASLNAVNVKMPGGVLRIERDNNGNFFMIGTAKRLPTSEVEIYGA